jgi:hypothetical protein
VKIREDSWMKSAQGESNIFGQEFLEAMGI